MPPNHHQGSQKTEQNVERIDEILPAKVTAHFSCADWHICPARLRLRYNISLHATLTAKIHELQFTGTDQARNGRIGIGSNCKMGKHMTSRATSCQSES